MEITTIIPTYIQSPSDLSRLRRALISVQAQEDVSVHLLISDDTSDPIMKAHLRELLSETVHSYEYVCSGLKSNASMNTNYGVSRANGTYIHILHQDDWIIRNRFYIDALDTLIEGKYSWVLATGITNNKVNHPQFNEGLIFGFNSIGGPSALLLRRKDWINLDHRFLMLPDVIQFVTLRQQLGSPFITKLPSIEYGTGEHKMTHRISVKEIDSDIVQLFNLLYVSKFPFTFFLFRKSYWGEHLLQVSQIAFECKNISIKSRFAAKAISLVCKAQARIISIKGLFSSKDPNTTGI